MKVITGKILPQVEPALPEKEVVLREMVVAEAAAEFGRGPWRLVSNGCRKIYGLSPGIYPAIVALDGTDTSVAWFLEVATPAMLDDEAAWESWARATGTGLPAILAVPSGRGRIAQQIAGILGVSFGLIYEYSLTLAGIRFDVSRGEAVRHRAH